MCGQLFIIFYPMFAHTLQDYSAQKNPKHVILNVELLFFILANNLNYWKYLAHMYLCSNDAFDNHNNNNSKDNYMYALRINGHLCIFVFKASPSCK